MRVGKVTSDEKLLTPLVWVWHELHIERIFSILKWLASYTSMQMFCFREAVLLVIYHGIILGGCTKKFSTEV